MKKWTNKSMEIFDAWYDKEYGAPQNGESEQVVLMRWRCWQTFKQFYTEKPGEAAGTKVVLPARLSVMSSRLDDEDINETVYVVSNEKSKHGVELTDRKTGLTARCHSERTYWRNRARAYVLLTELRTALINGDELVKEPHYATM